MKLDELKKAVEIVFTILASAKVLKELFKDKDD